MIEIREVLSRKEQKIFATFNYNMYKNVSQAVPDLITDELASFNPKKNPAYDYSDVKQFLAYKNGECVGRIAAIISKAANKKWKTRRIRFSRVDFIDDYDVSAALFNAVEEYGRSKGLTQIHGPIGFSDMDQQGMLVEGFEEPGMFITIYNHPYYIKHLEKLGYIKDIDWVEFKVMLPEKPNERIKKLSDAVLRKFKLTLVEPKTTNDIKQYLPQVFRVINICYKDLYGTVELSKAQIIKYYKEFILLINPEYVKFLVDEKGVLIGFGLALPSLNEAVKKSRARLFPLGWYRLLKAPKAKAKVLDLYLVGVIPSMQNKGLTAVLLNSMSNVAAKNGILHAETGPELETNHQVQALWKHFETVQHKRRRCWIKDL